ncbi:hypothetical protein LZ32DRAFT_612248 [Colletotrichum eremochloae]|nr:hypothetical protein LZ32DRAFT_612248 [Colletotrichum eremochloae]
MCDVNRVKEWLANVRRSTTTPYATFPTIPEPAKHKRGATSCIPTPPASDHALTTEYGSVAQNMSVNANSPHNTQEIEMADGDSPFTPNKRQRLVPALADPDHTPRPLRPTDSVSQYGGTSSITQSTTSSARSRRTGSPTKQLQAAELGRNPIKVLALDSVKTIKDIDARPGLRALRECLNAITRFTKGKGIVPQHHSETIAEQNPGIDLSDDSYYTADDSAERRYGPMPSFQAVKSIVLASQYGIEEGFDEACWDREVHFRLLCLALRRPLDSVKDGPVNFTPSTAAAIHTGFMKGALSRMVDFCVYIDSDVVGDRDPAISSAINNVREASGYASVNHTSHFHLRNKPISLSIESKQRNASLDDAHLQIGVWHSAQWTYLDRLAQKRGVTRGGLPFLPGLIVQAEDWHFVASTCEGPSTILWSKKFVGSTSDTEGAYQVIRVIQYLAWWTQAVYWPWYRFTILGLDEAPDNSQRPSEVITPNILRKPAEA